MQHNIFQLTPSHILEAGPIITALQEKAAEIWQEDIDVSCCFFIFDGLEDI